MAEYYPLLARAVSSLEKNTGDARRALYERARTALNAQLRGVTPALGEADITRERLALEEAIRRVEMEAARRPHGAAPQPETPPWDQARPATRGPTPAFGPGGGEPPYGDIRQAEPTQSEPGSPFEPTVAGRRADRPAPGERFSPSDRSFRGVRDGMAGGDDIREPAAPSAKPAHDPFAGFPPAHGQGRIEPSLTPEELLSAPRELPSPKPSEARPGMTKPHGGPVQLRPHSEDFERPPGRQRLGSGSGALTRLVIAACVVVALGTAGVFAYLKWPSIAGMLQSESGPAGQMSQNATQSRSKIADRISGGSQNDAPGTQPGSGPAAEVAQRVVLYEQDPETKESKQYIGSVIWRAETVSPGPGLPPDLAIKADVEIPDRKMRINFTMRRNREETLPASHTIEIIFNVPPDFSHGGIADVPGVLMEDAEQNRGAPLAGLRVKVTDGFFLIGLSSVESEVRRNELLLKDRPWLNIPIIFKNNQRALLAMEKGVPGDRVFADAFAAWQK